MWHSLSLPWRACLSAAWEAYCAGTYPIGAAVVGADGCLISTGRNRVREAREVRTDFLAGTNLAHAEINALLAVPPGAPDPRTLAVYTTTEPCPMCAGAIVMADVRAVRYAARDPWAGATDMYQHNDYLRAKAIQVEGPLDRLGGQALETLIFALQVDFFCSPWSGGKVGVRLALLERMAEANPAGVALGEKLQAEGRLEEMRGAGVPPSMVFDTLEKEI
jgi:tRNA(adenine34) deaminase